jgi:hypothetical protein
LTGTSAAVLAVPQEVTLVLVAGDPWPPHPAAAAASNAISPTKRQIGART